MLNNILDAVWVNPKRGFPVLISTTGWGKTHALYDYAQAKRVPLLICNAQLETEEDLGGHPVREAKTNTVRYTMPAFLTTALEAANIKLGEPCILFLDELDKARNDVLTCLLTLTSMMERRLRTTRFANETLIVGAMNPPQRQLPDPLLSRMLMLPFPLEEQYYKAWPKSIQSLGRKLYKRPDPQFPIRPIAPSSMFTLAQWFDVPTFWENTVLQHLIVRGLFPEQQVSAVLDEITQEQPITDPVQWIKKASPASILASFIPKLSSLEPPIMADVMNAFLERAQADKTGDIADLYLALGDDKFAEAIAVVHLPPEHWPVGQAAFEKSYANQQGLRHNAKAKK